MSDRDEELPESGFSSEEGSQISSIPLYLKAPCPKPDHPHTPNSPTLQNLNTQTNGFRRSAASAGRHSRVGFCICFFCRPFQSFFGCECEGSQVSTAVGFVSLTRCFLISFPNRTFQFGTKAGFSLRFGVFVFEFGLPELQIGSTLTNHTPKYSTSCLYNFYSPYALKSSSCGGALGIPRWWGTASGRWPQG